MKYIPFPSFFGHKDERAVITFQTIDAKFLIETLNEEDYSISQPQHHGRMITEFEELTLTNLLSDELVEQIFSEFKFYPLHMSLLKE